MKKLKTELENFLSLISQKELKTNTKVAISAKEMLRSLNSSTDLSDKSRDVLKYLDKKSFR